MAKVNISDAIKLSGVSRQTFYTKYINAENIEDRITVEEDHLKKKCIDTAELIRVFGHINLDKLDETTSDHTKRLIQPSVLELQSRISTLETEVKLQQQVLEYAKEQIRRSEVRETELHRHIEELIKNRQPEEPQKQIGWWGKLMGKG